MAGSDVDRLGALVAGLRVELAVRDATIVELGAQVKRLTGLLEEARRAGKRQASPFSKGDPVADPKRPGRKKGSGYGRHARRAVPERVDYELEARLSGCCPDCGGVVVGDGVREQFVCEVPESAPKVTRIRVHVGRCTKCRRRVQGRHPFQHSDALGAAGVMLGPRALGIGHLLHYRYGLSFGRCAAILSEMFGLKVSRAALCRAAASTAVELAPTHALIRETVNAAPAVTADETGWRVGGGRRWLWVVTSPAATLFRVCEGRGFDDAKTLLDADYSGVLVRDGWAPYRSYDKATHQSCIAHLTRRAHELKIELPAVQARFPVAVAKILDEALAWRDEQRPLAERIDAADMLGLRLKSLCATPLIGEPNRRFAKHLTREADAIFTFLTHDNDAANWRAEQAIRPAVVNRKTFGGNRTGNGASTLSVITSVLVTATQQGHAALDVLVRSARAPAPAPAFTIN